MASEEGKSNLRRTEKNFKEKIDGHLSSDGFIYPNADMGGFCWRVDVSEHRGVGKSFCELRRRVGKKNGNFLLSRRKMSTTAHRKNREVDHWRSHFRSIAHFRQSLHSGLGEELSSHYHSVANPTAPL